MQDDLGFAALVRHDLDLQPAHIANARSKGLGNGLLGGKSSGVSGKAVGAVSPLGFGEETLVEALAKTSCGVADARHLDQVNAGPQHERLRAVRAGDG